MTLAPLLKNVGRIAAAAAIAAGVLTLVFAGAAAADDDDFERPRVFPFGVAPGSISVSWEHSGSGVAYFTVTRESPSFVWGNVNAAQRTVFDSGLQPSSTYRYYVCAWFATFDGAYACSDWVSGTTLAPASNGSPAPASGGSPPPAPALTATARSVSEIYLKWEHPGYAARLTSAALYRDGRVIYEALQPGNFDSDHVDVVQPNSTHRYHFCFKNPDGQTCSTPLTRSPLPPPPAPPTNVQVADFTPTSVVIRWQPGAGADEYGIHCLDRTDGSHCGFPHKEAGGRMGVDRVRNADQPVNATTYYTLRNLRAGHRYEIAVCASQDRTKYGLAVNPTACAPGMIITGDGTIERCSSSACQIIQGEKRVSESQAAPADLTGTLAATRTRIDLRWTASPGATSYELRGANEDSGLFFTRTLTAGATTYTDEIGANQSGDFIYELKACAANGCSAPVTVVVRL